jgi:CRP-like cAMP-binding protein
MTDPTAAGLAEVPLLADLPEEILTALATRFEVEEHQAGHAVVTEGRPGYAFYVVRSGSLTVTQGGSVLRTLGAGDFFGEISILGEGLRTATVTTSEPCELWVLFGTSFRVLQSQRPDVAGALEAAMEDRLAAG